MSCVGKDGEPDMDWKEVVEHVANVQRAALKYKTTEPLVMYRYVKGFDYLNSPDIGQTITFDGFTSLFGSSKSKLRSNYSVDWSFDGRQPFAERLRRLRFH
ncbi:MAG: hypothetical protein LBG58_11625 [Planctomycetaceae bacterium]|nr:hypothetical protein [Planctomycetaceae bacterium]